MGEIRIGISGWRYPPWRGVFYPEGLAQARELEFASQALPTIEINGSFYSLQSPASYARWREATPEDFVFAAKGGRYITHIRRLQEVETPLANFLASGLFNLRHKLGPLLWQFSSSKESPLPTSVTTPSALSDFLHCCRTIRGKLSCSRASAMRA